VKKVRSNWNQLGGSMSVPSGPTSFEEVTRTLGLSPSDYQGSPELRRWVTENKNSRYVPSDLLKAWGLTVDAGL
jgi:hypothetical protein